MQFRAQLVMGVAPFDATIIFFLELHHDLIGYKDLYVVEICGSKVMSCAFVKTVNTQQDLSIDL